MNSKLSETLFQLFGENGRIHKRQSVGGGDINTAAVLILTGGQRVFIKENRADLKDMFAAEATGLEALGKTAVGGHSPPVPKVLAHGVDGKRSFLLLEEIPAGKLKSGADFGRAMAALHWDSRQGESRREKTGFDSGNWIGRTPQPNESADSWIDFFRERRLEFQWSLLRQNGYGDTGSGRNMQSLLNRLENLLPEVEDGIPSLLHGDLWGGNWVAAADGRAWLVDPAVYYGHREADIAMTLLFGGFPPGFHTAYNETWPLIPGFSERKDIYNLYHLMNHVNLFGSSYWGSVQGILMRFG